METKAATGFTSWRDASPNIKLTWRDAYELSYCLPMLSRQWPAIKPTVNKNGRMAVIKGLSASQVFFIKQWASQHDASVRELK